VHFLAILVFSLGALLFLTRVTLWFAPMFGWRVTARHEEFITFRSHEVPRMKIREAVGELRWKLVRDESTDMAARVSITGRSWGELVSLQFRDGGAVLKSECVDRMQLWDYGKNRMNVRDLKGVLEKKNA
jgi:hypothetical protein